MSSALTQLPSAATHSSLDLFEKNPVLVNFDHGNVQEVYPMSGGLESACIDFEIRTDRNNFLDMSELYLNVCVQIVNLNTKKLLNTKEHPVILSNNGLHSLFSNIEVSLNGEVVSSSNSLYAQKAFITTEWSHSAECKQSILQTQGYTYEPDPSDLEEVFEMRKEVSWSEKDTVPNTYHLFGKLAVDLFNCGKLLIPKSVLRIKLTKHEIPFALTWCSDTFVVGQGEDQKTVVPGNYALIWRKLTMYTKQMTVNDTVWMSIEKALLRTPARYTFTETEAKTFIIPGGQSTFVRENIFNNRPIRSLAIAMNTNEGFGGKLLMNQFHYQPFGLQRIVLYRNGNVLFDNSLKDGGMAQVYYNTIRNLHYNHDSPGIPLKDYKNHFVIVYDLTSTQQSHNQVYYPELVGGALRLELTFEKALEQSIQLFILGEQLSSLYIKHTGEVYRDV